MTVLFTKTVYDTSVGHLYEHIFVDTLTRHLRSAGFFSYVDYHLSAKTLHKGLVTLEVEVYNNSLIEVIDTFLKEPLSIHSDQINGGLLQILAEFSSDIEYLNKDALDERLAEYNKAPWVKGGHSTTPKGNTIVQPSIIYEELNSRAPNTIEQTLTVDTDKLPKHLWPLSLIVTKALRNNLIEDITASVFCFSYKDTYTMTGDQLVDTNFYRIDKRQASSITIEHKVASRLIQEIKRKGFIERLGESLRTARKDSPEYPVVGEITAKLHMNVADDIWKETATSENIRKILELIRVDFKFKETKLP